MRRGASSAASALALCTVFAVATVPYGAGGQGAGGPLVPEECQDEPCSVDKIQDVFINIQRWLIIVAGAASVLAIVVTGIRYIVAVLGGADSGAIQAAKQSLGLAVLGVFLLLLSYVIVRTVATILGATKYFE